MPGKEFPKFEPLSKRERDELEGQTPIQKEMIQHGLQTPWDETLKELEFKAGDVLPENPPKKIKKENGAELADDAFYQVFEEYDSLLSLENDAINTLNGFHKDYFKYFPKEMIRGVLEITPIIDVFIGLYNFSSTNEERTAILKRINGLFEAKIYLAQEINRAVEKKINEEGKEKE